METLLIEYKFEMEHFNLGPNPFGGRENYLPDMWLPQRGYFLEIKGAPPTAEEIWKAQRVSELTNKPIFIFYGRIAEFQDEQGSSSAIKFLGSNITPNCWWTRCPACRELDIRAQGIGVCRCGFSITAALRAYEDSYIVNALRLARKVKLPHAL